MAGGGGSGGLPPDIVAAVAPYLSLPDLLALSATCLDALSSTAVAAIAPVPSEGAPAPVAQSLRLLDGDAFPLLLARAVPALRVSLPPLLAAGVYLDDDAAVAGAAAGGMHADDVAQVMGWHDALTAPPPRSVATVIAGAAPDARSGVGWLRPLLASPAAATLDRRACAAGVAGALPGMGTVAVLAYAGAAVAALAVSLPVILPLTAGSGAAPDVTLTLDASGVGSTSHDADAPAAEVYAAAATAARLLLRTPAARRVTDRSAGGASMDAALLPGTHAMSPPAGGGSPYPLVTLSPAALCLALDALLQSCVPTAHRALRALGLPVAAFGVPWVASGLLGSIPATTPSLRRWLLARLAVAGWAGWLAAAVTLVAAVRDDLAAATTRDEALTVLRTFPRRHVLALPLLLRVEAATGVTPPVASAALLVAAAAAVPEDPRKAALAILPPPRVPVAAVYADALAAAAGAPAPTTPAARVPLSRWSTLAGIILPAAPDSAAGPALGLNALAWADALGALCPGRPAAPPDEPRPRAPAPIARAPAAAPPPARVVVRPAFAPAPPTPPTPTRNRPPTVPVTAPSATAAGKGPTVPPSPTGRSAAASVSKPRFSISLRPSFGGGGGGAAPAGKPGGGGGDARYGFALPKLGEDDDDGGGGGDAIGVSDTPRSGRSAGDRDEALRQLLAQQAAAPPEPSAPPPSAAGSASSRAHMPSWLAQTRRGPVDADIEAAAADVPAPTPPDDSRAPSATLLDLPPPPPASGRRRATRVLQGSVLREESFGGGGGSDDGRLSDVASVASALPPAEPYVPPVDGRDMLRRVSSAHRRLQITLTGMPRTSSSSGAPPAAAAAATTAAAASGPLPPPMSPPPRAARPRQPVQEADLLIDEYERELARSGPVRPGGGGGAVYGTLLADARSRYPALLPPSRGASGGSSSGGTTRGRGRRDGGGGSGGVATPAGRMEAEGAALRALRQRSTSPEKGPGMSHAGRAFAMLAAGATAAVAARRLRAAAAAVPRSAAAAAALARRGTTAAPAMAGVVAEATKAEGDRVLAPPAGGGGGGRWVLRFDARGHLATIADAAAPPTPPPPPPRRGSIASGGRRGSIGSEVMDASVDDSLRVLARGGPPRAPPTPPPPPLPAPGAPPPGGPPPPAGPPPLPAAPVDTSATASFGARPPTPSRDAYERPPSPSRRPPPSHTPPTRSPPPSFDTPLTDLNALLAPIPPDILRLRDRLERLRASNEDATGPAYAALYNAAERLSASAPPMASYLAAADGAAAAATAAALRRPARTAPAPPPAALQIPAPAAGATGARPPSPIGPPPASLTAAVLAALAAQTPGAAPPPPAMAPLDFAPPPPPPPAPPVAAPGAWGVALAQYAGAAGAAAAPPSSVSPDSDLERAADAIMRRLERALA